MAKLICYHKFAWYKGNSKWYWHVNDHAGQPVPLVMGTINALLPVNSESTNSPEDDETEPAFSDPGDSTEKNPVITV